MDDPVERRVQWRRFVGDLAWGSSRLEGSSYSRIDTDTLLNDHVLVSGKPQADGVLIANHRAAMGRLERWIHDQNRDLGTRTYEIPVDVALGVHADLTRSPVGVCPDELVSDGNGAEGAWPGMLPDSDRGVFRSYTPNGLVIGGSSYIPPQAEGRPPNFIADEAARLLCNAQTWGQQHPVDEAFFLLSRLPYLQPFRDGNKRTSRVLANAPLLQAGWAPLSYGTLERSDYHRALVAFYEFGEEKTLARLVIGQVVEAQLDRMRRTEMEQGAWWNGRQDLMSDLVSFVVDNAPLAPGRLPSWVGRTPEETKTALAGKQSKSVGPR